LAFKTFEQMQEPFGSHCNERNMMFCLTFDMIFQFGHFLFHFVTNITPDVWIDALEIKTTTSCATFFFENN